MNASTPSTPKGRHIYLEIADELRRLITSGQVRPGQQLPTESELAEQWTTTRMTARAAYRELISRGWVVSRKRKGYFVREATDMTWYMSRRDSVKVTSTSAVDPWVGAVQEAGHRAFQIIDVRTVDADKLIMGVPVGEILGVASGDLVACRDRLRYINNVPSEIAVTYYPYALVKDTAVMHPEDIQPGIFPIFAEMGHTQTGFSDTVRSRMPSEAESRRLELDPGTPVLEMVRRTYFTPDGACRLVRHSIYLGGDTKFVWEVDAA